MQEVRAEFAGASYDVLLPQDTAMLCSNQPCTRWVQCQGAAAPVGCGHPRVVLREAGVS